jgi:hypothetical protein
MKGSICVSHTGVDLILTTVKLNKENLIRKTFLITLLGTSSSAGKAQSKNTEEVEVII